MITLLAFLFLFGFPLYAVFTFAAAHPEAVAGNMTVVQVVGALIAETWWQIAIGVAILVVLDELRLAARTKKVMQSRCGRPAVYHIAGGYGGWDIDGVPPHEYSEAECQEAVQFQEDLQNGKIRIPW